MSGTGWIQDIQELQFHRFSCSWEVSLEADFVYTSVTQAPEASSVSWV